MSDVVAVPVVVGHVGFDDGEEPVGLASEVDDDDVAGVGAVKLADDWYLTFEVLGKDVVQPGRVEGALIERATDRSTPAVDTDYEVAAGRVGHHRCGVLDELGATLPVLQVARPLVVQRRVLRLGGE